MDSTPTAASRAGAPRVSPLDEQATLPPQPPPVRTIAELKLRFLQVRGHFCAAKVPEKHPFNPWKFEKEAKEHAKRYKITSVVVSSGSQVNTNHSEPPTQPVVVNNVATFDRNHFFQDPNNLQLIFSGCDERTVAHFRSKGFTEIGVKHYTNGEEIPEDLPRPTALERPQVLTEDIVVREGPATLCLPPTGIPKLWKPTGKTTAWAIMHAMETKVYDYETGTCYSPYKLWTKEARSAAKLAKNTSFQKYFAAYFILRTARGSEPALCKDKISVLYGEATAFKKANAYARAAEWFDMANAVIPKLNNNEQTAGGAAVAAAPT